MPTLVYDPDEIRRTYQWRWWQVWGRTWQILLALGGFWLGLQWDRWRHHSEINVAKRSQQLRQILTELGPTFIKVGQALSTRPDLVRKDFLEELTKLQDQLPGFPTEVAQAKIERELGRPLQAIFAEMSAEPVAAASLGQVYKARLRSNGAWVAVKVQRPGLVDKLSLDLYVIRWWAGWLAPWLPLNLGNSLTHIVDEFGTKLFEEIDYLHEGENCERFAAYFHGDPDVCVPRIYWDYSTKEVLTLEWIDGIKLTDTERIREAGLDIQKLIRIGVVSALKQLLEYGFFHADPHPGNLFALRDGRLAYIDFGMMDQLSESNKEGLIDALVHLVDRDYHQLVNDFIRLGFLLPDVDVEPLIPALEVVLADVLTQEVRSFNFKTATDQFSDLMYKYPFQIPANFGLIIRSLVTLEGVALSLYPAFQIVAVAYPYVAKRLLVDESPRIRQRLLQVIIKDGKIRWNRLENLLRIAQLEGDLDVLPTAQMALTYLLSPESLKVRRQLILAQTADDQLHLEGLGKVWQVISAQLQPQRLWERVLKNLPPVALPHF
ncbi:MAG: AarF/ABC1/UbiB kinase family protein [Thermostichales cyanobacterium DRC_bins_46]